MARHKVDICGVDTANIKVLSYEKQIELFERLKAGDDFVKEELVNGNLKLVLSILKSFTGRCDNMDDLFQVGVIGLIKAIDNFDLSYGVKFSTYAVPMILGEVKRYLRDNSSVRISRSVKDLAYKILQFKEDFLNENNREASLEEIRDEFNISSYELSNALNSLKDTVSMYEPIYSDGGDVIFLEDQLSSDEGAYDIETKISLKRAFEKLKEKERYILVQRYMIGKTQMELAEEIGISQAQISRIEKNGLNNVKRLMK